MAFSLFHIERLFRMRGGTRYGAGAVSQLEHALQCAHLAESAGAVPALVTACFLHDLGHLLAGTGPGAPDSSVDDAHQYVAMAFLHSIFPEVVLAPIRLHVEAIRYLCAVEPDYWLALSDAARRSLELQGGPFREDEGARFIAQPYAESAVLLRRWDDQATSPNTPTPDLAHFLDVIAACVR